MDRLISEQEVLDVIASWFESVEQQRILQGRIKAIPSADEDEWVKRSDVVRVIDKRVDEALAEQYKGMTNGQVITEILKDAEWAELTSDIGLAQEDIIYIKVGGYWWNSPYSEERSDKE